ncbi:MAG: MBL fold metallo-hydrolase [Bacteroidales bacterium]|nr:MBL fold metallo-hydrolase [Bacteroidales bacterium]
MKIINLTEKSKIYTSNVFLILGYWNAVDDVNTLVDVGRDENIIKKIENINTGLGKKKIDQVILTHSHSDHAGLLPVIKKVFKPKVYAFNSFVEGIDHVLKDGDKLMLGDKTFEVFHITAHSNDSICLFCEDEGILFAGDTIFPVKFDNPVIDKENSYVLSRLQGKNIKTVYYGHGSSQVFKSRKFEIIN